MRFLWFLLLATDSGGLPAPSLLFFQGPSPCSLTLRQCLPIKELAASKTVYQTMDQ